MQTMHAKQKRLHPAAVRHAIQYLRTAEVLAAAGRVTADEALASIGRAEAAPCRALGEAKRALQWAHGDAQLAMRTLRQQLVLPGQGELF